MPFWSTGTLKCYKFGAKWSLYL